MTHRFLNLMMTPSVRAAQAENGSAEVYGRFAEEGGVRDELGERERSFIVARDSFYMATVSEDDWPYLQHRGGPVGFVKVTGPQTLAIADYRGNRQYLSVGNLKKNNRAALFLMDYPNRRRLKVLARTRVVEIAEDPALIAAVQDEGYRAKIERALVFDIEAFDWNCPAHITPRYSEAELENLIKA